MLVSNLDFASCKVGGICNDAPSHFKWDELGMRNFTTDVDKDPNWIVQDR